MSRPDHEIVDALIRAMESEHGMSYEASLPQQAILIESVARMRAAGCAFSDGQIDIIGAGEESEVEALFGGFDGYSTLHDALDEVFDSVFDEVSS